MKMFDAEINVMNLMNYHNFFFFCSHIQHFLQAHSFAIIIVISSTRKAKFQL